MDSRLNENEAEFGVAIFAVDFKMLADRYCLFDEVIKIFGNGWCESWKSMCISIQSHVDNLRILTIRFENAKNFVTSDSAEIVAPRSA